MREVNLTRGPIMGRLVRFSLPMIAGNMLQQVYNLVDTLVVGRGIGANALAAVGSAYTLMTFLTSILIGLCMGSGAFFSEDYGAGDTAQLRQDMLLSFWFIFGVSVLIYGVIYPGMNPILRLLQTPEELMALMQESMCARCLRGFSLCSCIISLPIFCGPWAIRWCHWFFWRCRRC